jgi:hypothetical protein
MGSLGAWLRLADSVITFFVFWPFLVACWRGTWDLVGHYMIPQYPLASRWAILGLGMCGAPIGYFIFPSLGKYLKKKNKVTYYVGSRIAMYVYSILYMTLWRGVWTLLDYYVEEDPFWLYSSTAFFYLLAVCLRLVRAIMWPPMVTMLDHRHSILVPVTRFGSKVSHFFTF